MRRRRGLIQRALGGMFSLVSVVALAIPAVVWWRERTERSVVSQQSTDLPVLPAAEMAAYRELASQPAAPLILSYHDIRPDVDPEEDRYTVTPEQFAEHMVMLKAAGFRTITSQQVRGWLEGADLPPRSVYLTFDDGTSGIWRYADPILEDVGFTGAVFVITGKVGENRPYYLTWSELRRLHETGRWDLESHTADGHGKVAIDERASARQPFLINRMWLAEEGRLETLEEFQARVTHDLRESKRAFEREGLPAPDVFAFPFSAQITPTNDERAPAIVDGIIGDLFIASMTNVEPARYLTVADRETRELPRVEVFANTSTRDLYDRLVGARTLQPEAVDPLAEPNQWFDSGGQPFTDDAEQWSILSQSDRADEVSFGQGSLTVRPDGGRWLGMAFAPSRTLEWRTYSTTVSVSGLGAAESGRSAGVIVHLGSRAQITVNVSATFVSVQRGRGDAEKDLASERLTPADSRTVNVRIANGTLSVDVDGTTIVSGAPVPDDSSGGVALSVNDARGGDDDFVFEDLVLEDAPG